MKEKLNLITEKAKRDKEVKFTSLMHLINEENLVQCYSELKRYKASGIDGVTVEEYGKNLRENVRHLVERLKTKSYRCQPARRVYIPKAGKKDEKRGLGIPTVEDKLVQMMVKKLLEAIYETDFCRFLLWISAESKLRRSDKAAKQRSNESPCQFYCGSGY